MAQTKVSLVDLNANELILDLDGDTSLHSSTDDQIDIKIAGADDFTFTANAFNVLASSNATFADSSEARFGAGTDLQIYHDGTNSFIENKTGALKIATETSGIAITLGHTTSEVTIADNLTVTGTLAASTSITVGSAALTEAELEKLDGITNGTVIANKAIVTDANIDITGGRNITITGELDAATLDISGAIDVAGNSVLASLDVTAVATAATFEPDGDTAAGDNAAIGFTAAEGLILTGQGSTNDVTIKNDADADVIEIPTGTVNVTMAGTLGVTGVVSGAGFTAGNAVLAEAELELLDGLTAGTAIASKVVTTDANIDTSGQRNLTISGELDAATGDFSGAVDVAGATTTAALTASGVVTANAGVVVDNFTLDGTTLALSSGDFTVDVAGDILLDAGDSDLRILQGGTDYCKITKDGNNTAIKSQISDGDLILRGSDGGSQVDALTFDMSAAGAATFNDKITAVGTSVFTNLDISGDIDVDGTTNLDVVDIDGAVNMATTALVTGVLTTTAATVFNGGFASNADSSIGGTTPTLTIGDGGAEDAKILFDGNAQNFYIGLDDSTDKLTIGLGNALGTTPGFTMDENTNVVFPDNQVTIQTTGTGDHLTLVSTDAGAGSGPILKLFRDSATAADGDNLGFIKFFGKEESDGDEAGYVQLQGKIVDSAAGSPDGALNVEIVVNDSGKSAMLLGPTEAVFNNDSIDIDFRVESNDNAYQLFVDGGNNKIYTGAGSGNSIDNMHLQLQNQGLTVSSFANDGNSNEIHFIKSRNTTVGSSTVVADGDQIGSIIFQGDDGTDYATPAASIRGIVGGTPGGNDMPGALIFSTTADGAAAVSERMRITSAGIVGIGATASAVDLGVGLHIRTADSGASVAADCDELVIENSANAGISILSGTSNNGRISFGDSGGNQMGQLKYEHSVNSLIFNSNATEALRISTSQVLSTGAEASPDTTNGGITIQTNAEDGAAFTLKNSDIAHGITGGGGYQTDTYGVFLKNSAANGGLRIQSASEDAISFKHEAWATGTNTAESGASTSAWCVDARIKNNDTVASLAADDNLASFRTSDVAQFIVKGDGELFSNTSATVGTFDAYEDAQLVRAFDLSHMKGVIDSKFDKFVQYNKDDLQKAKLIGTDENGNATAMVNITGMSRLHNGAIWQQYEATQKLTQAMFELAKETLGEEKAKAILEKHEVKLLN